MLHRSPCPAGPKTSRHSPASGPRAGVGGPGSPPLGLSGLTLRREVRVRKEAVRHRLPRRARVLVAETDPGRG
jgi:hypothetical protein